MTATTRRSTAPTEDPATAASPWSGRRRRPRDHDVKRDAVIRAAARAFNARGYHHTSLDDIAADLGVTKPTVYYYVENKEQLLFECFLAGLHPIREAFREAERAGGSGRERMNAVIRGYALAIASEYGWCMVRAHDLDLRPAMRRQINTLKSEIDQGIRGLLQAGMTDGSIEPCDPRSRHSRWRARSTGSRTGTAPTRRMTAADIADAFVAVLRERLPAADP